MSHVTLYRNTTHLAARWRVQKDYDEIVPQDIRDDWGDFHYTRAIRNVIGAIDKWRPYHGIEEPLEYIFDWEEAGSESSKEIEEVMAQAEHVSGDLGLYSNFTFRKRRYFRDCNV